jgi:pimeloyl-ACP methyl ester carboxylesterase
MKTDYPYTINSQNDGNHVNYITQGDGPPVIMIHGVAASLYDWEHMTSELASQGYRGYALDLLGHGESAKPDQPEEYHVETLYNHFNDWVAELNFATPPVLVGHSLGGYLSLLHAIRYPEKVRALVLIDPFFSPGQLSPLLRLVRTRPKLGSKVMKVAPEWLIHTLLGWDPEISNNFSPEVRQQIATDYKRSSPYFVYITKDLFDLTPNLRQVKKPTQIIWGEHDRTLNPSTFPELAQTLANASSYMVPKCGHQPHIGKPNLVNQLTLNFLDSLTPVDAHSSPK